MSMLFLALAVLAAGPAFGLAAAAPAEPAQNVAVLDFSANNVSAGEASVVSEFVRAAMVRSGVYPVVDKSNMTRILNEQAFQQTGCTSEDCAVKLGKLLNVHKMVVGEYSVLEGVKFLTAKLVDVETGRIERTGRVKDFTVVNADEAADRLVAQLTGVTPAGMAFGDTVGAKPKRPGVPPRDRTRFVVGLGGIRGSQRGTADFSGSPGGPFPGAVRPFDTPRYGGLLHLGIRQPIGKPRRFGAGLGVELGIGNVGGESFRFSAASASTGRTSTFTGSYGDWTAITFSAVATRRVKFVDFYAGAGYYVSVYKLDAAGDTVVGTYGDGWDAYPPEINVKGVSVIGGAEFLLIGRLSLDVSVRASVSASAGFKTANTQVGPQSVPAVAVSIERPDVPWFAGTLRVSF